MTYIFYYTGFKRTGNFFTNWNYYAKYIIDYRYVCCISAARFILHIFLCVFSFCVLIELSVSILACSNWILQWFDSQYSRVHCNYSHKFSCNFIVKNHNVISNKVVSYVSRMLFFYVHCNVNFGIFFDNLAHTL